ncbi:uncharacterized protein L203_105499 [Cryptococcus depauperatus CBS 7841]|uniref:Uncharacterized protein n=1 Tax=Cryptococcus depauperatus CBS 7841 TaxID=1295531 RepID=A0A1E3ICZ7_9TREE|nr:endopeptidase [Cryptococcus depauperatus CBS 7841]
MTLASQAAAVPVEPVPIYRLKLRKIPTIRNSEHPVEAYERHHQAAVKRLYRFKRLPQPKDDFFLKRTIQRRQLIQDNPKLDKKTWIPLVSPEKIVPKFNGQERRAFSHHDNYKAANTTTSSEEVKQSNSGFATNAAAVARPTATVAASGSNVDGFSQAAIDALNRNILTNSSSKLIQGGLNYIIESNDIGYLCEIQIGTPCQTFLMLMDTGSADTWVPSTKCGQQRCGKHTALGDDVSSTFRGINRQFQVTYGSGAVSGVLAADTMIIAGMTLNNHSMGVTLQESVQFSASNVPFDGLMGLALGKLSNQGVPTPIESLQSAGILKNTILGIALGRVNDGINNGELVFGQADKAKIDASTTQTLRLSSSDGFWQVEMAAVTVDGHDIVTGRQAILDTGTSLMIAPEADAIAFHKQIRGAADIGNGMFSVPCTINQMVTMTFGKIAFQIDVRDLIFQPLTPDLKGECLSSLSAGTIKDDVTWLLGDSFLKNVYMTTNADNGTIQLSARTDVPGSSSAGKTALDLATVPMATDNSSKHQTNNNVPISQVRRRL